MKSIAHLSDFHFGTAVEAVRDALLADLHASPPDLVVLTGDITQRARTSQFKEARRFLDALPPIPRIAVPGNHDLPLFDLLTRLRAPYRRFEQYIQAGLEPSFEDEEMAVFALNSTRVERHKDGAISAAQRFRIAGQIHAAPQPYRIVMLHHPLRSITASDQTNVAHGAVPALESWIAAGADLFLGGHIHLPYALQVKALRGQRSSVILQAGTALSWRVRAGIPNSYNRITLGPSGVRGRMLFERRDYDAGVGGFRPRSMHWAEKLADGWHLQNGLPE